MASGIKGNIPQSIFYLLHVSYTRFLYCTKVSLGMIAPLIPFQGMCIAIYCQLCMTRKWYHFVNYSFPSLLSPLEKVYMYWISQVYRRTHEKDISRKRERDETLIPPPFFSHCVSIVIWPFLPWWSFCEGSSSVYVSKIIVMIIQFVFYSHSIIPSPLFFKPTNMCRANYSVDSVHFTCPFLSLQFILFWACITVFFFRILLPLIFQSHWME